jgi:hypothetical protein
MSSRPRAGRVNGQVTPRKGGGYNDHRTVDESVLVCDPEVARIAAILVRQTNNKRLVPFVKAEKPAPKRRQMPSLPHFKCLEKPVTT